MSFVTLAIIILMTVAMFTLGSTAQCEGEQLGRKMATKTMQDEAIKHGLAEWVCDPKTGESTFTWTGQPATQIKDGELG